MKSYTLSKSSFIKGIQCEKQLYLYKHFYKLRDPISEEQQAIFTRGTNVGKLAQDLFPGGADLSPANQFQYEKAAKLTQEKIQSGVKVFYEPSFIYDELLVAVDILVKQRNKWHIYEVKSSTSISDTYIMDAAVQYYVLRNSGLDIKDVSIIYMNNQYVRQGELDINQLFTIESVLDLIEELQDMIPEWIITFKKVLKSKSIPDIKIGPQCNDPYPCSFLGYCWKDIPQYSVFNISGLKSDKKFELFNSGVVHIENIPDEYKLSDKQRLQVDVHKNRKTIIDKDGLKEFMDTIKYLLYFMDFETFMPAVPLYDNSRPYQQIPFQYALYYQKDRKSGLEYYEFLGSPESDARIPFIESLLQNTKRKGDILVYNKSFEITRLKEIVRDFPEYADDIEERIERIKDLMLPFQKKYYYKPEMMGSYSIKNVLPALVPDLSYEGMPVADGGMAMIAYESLLYETDPDKIESIRKNLLEYCKMDTYAMVRIWRELESIK
ncbi:MAG: DUF2779 domain-containing protein [Ignavibacterium sp.]|nr:DUF2779 domain-containing protein [Ignavibacterium sp.]